MVLSVLLLSLPGPARAEGPAACSPEDARQFCELWNSWFSRNGIDLYGGCGVGEDTRVVEEFHILYNGNSNEMDYRSGAVPAAASLFMLYDPAADMYSLHIISDRLGADLEKAVIYTDEKVIGDIGVDSTHEADSPDIWSVVLTADDLVSLLECGPFTVRLTIGGKSAIIDISEETHSYLYEMVYWLLRAQLYSDPAYEKYRSAEFLPDDGQETARTLEPASQGRYSFREDYERVDAAAKSLFYVEVYDNSYECTGNASGFVSFDEHLFVTNQHVIDGAAVLKVWDDDDNVFLINQVAVSDREHDLAILLFPEGGKYAALEQDSGQELKRGQPVVTIGSPGGLQNTVAYGNISAFPVIDGMKYIQFTAPISHGSSGGCLFDDNGRVIGVTSAGYDEGQNLNFAIPIRHVQDLYRQWDGSSYETLGSERSWDTAGITAPPAATAVPAPTPVLTAAPTRTPAPVPAATRRPETDPGRAPALAAVAKIRSAYAKSGLVLAFDVENRSGKEITAADISVMCYSERGTLQWNCCRYIHSEKTIRAGGTETSIYYRQQVKDDTSYLEAEVYRVYYADGTSEETGGEPCVLEVK